MIQLRAPAAVSLHLLARRVVAAGRSLHRAGLVAGTAGNLSVRLPEGLFLVTPSGVSKARLTTGDLLVVDEDGALVRGRAGLLATTEMPMHLEVYRRRPDVGAVVHAHPAHAVALSLATTELQRCCLPEAVATLGAIAVTRYTPPSSAENAAAISDLVGRHDAVVLAWHGSLTVGATIEEALDRTEVLEHAARILSVAHAIGPVPALDPAEIDALRRRGRAYRAASPR
jgi:L-fuculose-phosphate aldolase